MKKLNYILIALLAGLTALVLVLVLRNQDANQSKTNIAVIDNAKVFEAFQMKKDYDQKMEADLSKEKESLDSLDKLLNLSKGQDLGLKKQYQEISQQMNFKFQELSNRYTQEVYGRLNEYIKEYGIQNNYDLILGSNGQGNVMYLGKKVDITDTLIAFINQKYSN